jgi:hypothetical protein
MDEDLLKLMDVLDERRVNVAIEQLEQEIEEFASGRRLRIKTLRLLLRGAQALRGGSAKKSKSVNGDRGGVSTSSRPGDVVRTFLQHAGPSRVDAIVRGTSLSAADVQKVLSSGKYRGAYKQNGDVWTVA